MPFICQTHLIESNAFNLNNCPKCTNLIIETLNFYANQLLDYNEVVSQELLEDKGQKAKEILKLLEENSR